jgi:hypothetical protein
VQAVCVFSELTWCLLLVYIHQLALEVIMCAASLVLIGNRVADGSALASISVTGFVKC